MSIISGKKIEESVKNGDIEIDPFNPKYLNPASYDVTLGSKFAVYKAVVHIEKDQNLHLTPASWRVLDSKIHNQSQEFEIDDEGIVLTPGVGYLMHINERIHTNKFVPILDGKSSIGRLFVHVHVTAGYGDPGFNGQFTLEVIAHHPVKLYKNMRIAQVRFHEISGEVQSYSEKGNYVNERAFGPIPSRSWKQFND